MDLYGSVDLIDLHGTLTGTKPPVEAPQKRKSARPKKASGIEFGDVWRAQAACRGQDVSIWFPEMNHATKPDRRKRLTAHAKAVCSGCPVRQECLDYALATKASEGVYGGMDELDRNKERRRRKGAGR